MLNNDSVILAHLRQLRAHLQNAPEISSELAERAQRLMDDIAATLPGVSQSAPPSAPPEGDSPAAETSPKSLTDRLRQSVADFEATHPNLSQTLGNIADTLAQMGI